MKNAILSLIITAALLTTQAIGFPEEKPRPIPNEQWNAQLKEWRELPKGSLINKGLVWINGWDEDPDSGPCKQGAGVHVMPGWVLADEALLDGFPLITVTPGNKDDEKRIEYFVTSSYPSSSTNYRWLEVPGLRDYPTAKTHTDPFSSGNYLFAFLDDSKKDGWVYRTAMGSDGHATQIERTTKFPLAYIDPNNTGHWVVGSCPLFDKDGLWAGFLTGNGSPCGLNRNIFEKTSSETWIIPADLLNSSPSRQSLSMPGFPFQAFSAVLTSRNNSIEYRDRIGAYCARNPDEPWGWIALAMAQVYSGKSEERLGALNRAAQLMPESALVSCLLGDALADLLAFEQALPFYERALKINPSLTQRREIAQRIGNIYHVLGKHNEESTILFGSSALEKENIRSNFNYGEWLMSHSRYDDAETFLHNAWKRFQQDSNNNYFSSKALGNLLETLFKLGRTNDISTLFKDDYGLITDSEYRYVLADFWTRHNLADNKMTIYSQWLNSPSKGYDWLYYLPSPVLEKLLTNDRDLIRAAFEKPIPMMNWLFYKLDHCEDVLLEAEREKNLGISEIDIQVKCLHKLHRDSEAIALISKISAQKIYPSFDKWAGDLWLETGEHKRARDAYTSVIESGNNIWERWKGLSEALEALGEMEKASDAYTKTLQQLKIYHEKLYGYYVPSRYAYPLMLMKKLVELDKKDEVIDFCRYIVEGGYSVVASDTDGSTPEKLIEFLCSIDAGDIAVSALRNRLVGVPGDTYTWFLLGKLYLRLGDTFEAGICLHRLKDLKSETAADLEKEISKVANNKSVPAP
jgi:tetratricopeptide (TPR) repeat protein